MTKRKKSWVYSASKGSKPSVPAPLKAKVEQAAQEFVKTVLKPRHVQPPPENAQFNYIVDVYSKWYRHYFYFCAKYHVPDPNAIEPYFENKFARLEYIGNEHFNLSYERHNGQWFQIYSDISLDECLNAVKDDPWFQAL